MAVQFANLSNVSHEEIRNCFNLAFENYFVPLQLSPEQFKAKLTSEAIDLSRSFGCFDQDKLIGFILHGIDTLHQIPTAYNAGTGLLPAYRGNRLTLSLYRYSLTQLQLAGIKQSLLEVFQQNIPAIKTYQQAGFTINRSINSYKGKPQNLLVPEVLVQQEEEINWEWISQLSLWQPAWQYNNASLQRGGPSYRLWVASIDGTALGYMLFNTGNGRIARMGAAKNKEAVLTALLTKAAQLFEGDLTAIHINDDLTEETLKRLGLAPFIYSYEMVRELP